MKKQCLIHVFAAVLLSFLLYKSASFTLGTSMFIGIGAALLGLLYTIRKSKR